MSTKPSSIALALEADLADRNIDQKDLGAMLARAGQKPLSGGAITNWKARGSIPDKHLRRLIEMFGPTSHLAKLYPDLIKITVRGEQIAVARDRPAPPPPEPESLDAEVSRTARNPARSAHAIESARLNMMGTLWLKQIPDELRENTEVKIWYAGGERSIDYLSDTLAAEVTWMPRMLYSQRELPYYDVVRLAGLRQSSRKDGRQYVVILMKRPPLPPQLPSSPPLPPMPSEVYRQRLMNMFVVDCVNLGVMPLIDVAPDDVAETIVALHHHRIDLESDYSAPTEYVDLL